MDRPVARIILHNLTFVISDTIKFRKVALLKMLFFFFYLNGVEDCMQTRI